MKGDPLRIPFDVSYVSGVAQSVLPDVISVMEKRGLSADEIAIAAPSYAMRIGAGLWRQMQLLRASDNDRLGMRERPEAPPDEIEKMIREGTDRPIFPEDVPSLGDVPK